MRIRAFSLGAFKDKVRRAAAVSCILLLIQFLWAPLEAQTAPRQIKRQTQTAVTAKGATLTRAFSISTNGRENVELTIPAAGVLQVRAEWTGTAAKLALILNGPGLTQAYARRDGPSPLNLSFTITPELLSKGAAWRVSIADFQPNSTAKGSILVTLPPAAAAAGTASEKQPARASSASAKVAAGQKPEAGRQVVQGMGAQGLALLQARTEDMIAKASRTSPMAGIYIPLFYHELEKIAGDPGLMRQYFALSRHKKGQTENEFAGHFQKAVQAYRSIPADFKARHLNPSYINLPKGRTVDPRKLGGDIVRAIKPSFQTDIKNAFRSSFAQKRLTIQPPPARKAQSMVPKAGATAAKAGSHPPVQARQVGRLLRNGAAGLSAGDKNNLKTAVAASGFPIPQASTAHPAFQALDQYGTLRGALPELNGKQSVIDYYRYMVTLDWFHCTNKNETTDDEPYFSLITVLPQFDSADPSYFHYLKDGCLNNVAGFTTRTYGGVEGGSDHGLTGNDRVVFDYLTFNAPASFTVDLWEEDFSKGSVADGIHQAAMDIGAQVLQDVKAAVITEVISTLTEVLIDELASAGIQLSTQEALRFIDQLINGDLSFVDFEQLLYSLFSGRGINPAWFVVYFVFNGFDLAATLTTIGAGSWIVGLVILIIAIVGPTLADMFSSLVGGEVGQAYMDLLKICAVIPLIIDFFKRVVNGFIDFFKWLMAVIDPDDHIGTKTIVMDKITSDWHNDAMNGEWTPPKLMGAVPLNLANSAFAQRGYGPTAENSSFIYGGNFWVPGFTIKHEYTMALPNGQTYKGVDTEYDIYYEIKREIAGGRSTFGYYLPEPGVQCREITYTSKSSPAAWWKNVIRVSVLSINTTEFPWVCLVDTRTGVASSNWEPGQAEFEIEAVPGTTYKLSIWKFSPGEMAGYVSVYEGPQINVICQEKTGTGGGGPRAGQGMPPKKIL